MITLTGPLQSGRNKALPEIAKDEMFFLPQPARADQDFADGSLCEDEDAFRTADFQPRWWQARDQDR